MNTWQQKCFDALCSQHLWALKRQGFSARTDSADSWGNWPESGQG
ncbi:MAG: hypothetical protein V7629_21305 [Motiliproteus sp.]